MQALKEDLLNSNNTHQISWLDREELLEIAEKSGNLNQVLPVKNSKFVPKELTALLCFQITSLSGREIEYYDDDEIITPLSKEAVIRSSNLRKIFEHEKELRFEANTSSLLDEDLSNPDAVRFHLIKYAKFTCPSIIKFCRLA